MLAKTTTTYFHSLVFSTTGSLRIISLAFTNSPVTEAIFFVTVNLTLFHTQHIYREYLFTSSVTIDNFKSTRYYISSVLLKSKELLVFSSLQSQL